MAIIKRIICLVAFSFFTTLTLSELGTNAPIWKLAAFFALAIIAGYSYGTLQMMYIYEDKVEELNDQNR